MRRGLWAGVMGLAAAAGSAAGQAVEFRIVERQGQQAIVTPVGTEAQRDAVLNLAVQARVVGGSPTMGLGNFSFNIRIVGEPEANGTLALLATSSANGRYLLNATQSTSAGAGGYRGLPGAYWYLAAIGQGFFNGLINTSGGTFTNGPDQEILAITGVPLGSSLLLVTDIDGSDNPDTYTGQLPAAPGATAAVDPVIGAEYFGVGGKWVDVYRFRYTVSNTATARVLHFNLESSGGVSAAVFTEWTLDNGLWGAVSMNAPVTVAALDVPVGGTMACCDTATGVCAVVDGTQCPSGTFAASTSCQPSPCPVAGACCVSGGTCTTGAPGACAGIWTLGGTCDPNVCQQLVACCDSTGECSITATCTTNVAVLGGTCQPNPCPQPGACCESGGACTVTVRGECGDLWTPGACSVNACRRGTCCVSGVVCTVTLSTGCTGVWTVGATCGTVVCPGTGACCSGTSCFVSLAQRCTGMFIQYRGDGVACVPAGAFNACCQGNFNGVNGLEVTDIFAFLDAWFDGSPRADANMSGSLTVQDIFAFIAIWMNGC